MSVSVHITVPASNYWVVILEVRETESKVYVFARVGSPGGIGAAVITTVSDSVQGTQL